jgi:hypothetical protein
MWEDGIDRNLLISFYLQTKKKIVVEKKSSLVKHPNFVRQRKQTKQNFANRNFLFFFIKDTTFQEKMIFQLSYLEFD